MGFPFALSMPQWWSFHFGGAAIDPSRIAFRRVCYNLMWHFFDRFADPIKLPSDGEHMDHLPKFTRRKFQRSNPTPHIDKEVQSSSLTPNIDKEVQSSSLTHKIPCSSSALDLAGPTADEIRIREAVEASMSRLEASDFYKKFKETIKSPKFVHHFEKLKLTEQQLTGNSENFTLPIVLYGVGKIEEAENSRLQLSLAILLKRDFEWVEELVAFEPLATQTEIKVMQGFGCNWIPNKGKERRVVQKPTLFFMPAVPLFVHYDIYSANWGSAGLNKMIVFGNSYKTMTSLMPQMTYIFQVLHRDGVLGEVPVNGQGSGPPDDCSYNFEFYSWHFFNSSEDSNDQEKISVPNFMH